MNKPATTPPSEQVLFEGNPVALRSVGRWLLALLTLGLAALVYWVGAKGLRIRITQERVTLKRGLLSLTTDTVELYRVTDLQVLEPFGERLVGCGRLRLTSTDRTDGAVELEGLRNVETLANQMRSAVEAQKTLRRVHTVQPA